MLPYERLEAWRSAHQLALAVYRLTRSFPSSERYGLSSQLRRAAYSVAANIAEGTAKRGNGELRRFLDISIGSLSEIGYALRLAVDLEYVSRDEWERLDGMRNHAGKVVWGFYRSLKR